MAVDYQRDIDAVQNIAAVPTILDVVCRATGMGFAAVARVTEDRWIACQVLDNIHFGLPAGGELKVETTLCHDVRQHRQVVVIDNVAEDPTYCAHHTPQTYGLQSYISVPIVLPDGRFFRTLCAIDPKPANLNNPQILGTFKLFAELIAYHLDSADKVSAAEARLLEERTISETREQFIAVRHHLYCRQPPARPPYDLLLGLMPAPPKAVAWGSAVTFVLRLARMNLGMLRWTLTRASASTEQLR